jgi:polysaccharide biosynthesis/export protein
MKVRVMVAAALALVLASVATVHAGEQTGAAADLPGYVIGTDDVLEIAFWSDKDMYGEVVVRPDGRIALPILGEIEAAGLTPGQLTARLKALASDVLENPLPTVTVKQINSRKVFITGEVAAPGRYPLVGRTTVLELIAMAGGLTEHADRKNVGIVRTVNGVRSTFKFNYNKAARLKDLDQNIDLVPGDIVVVP